MSNDPAFELLFTETVDIATDENMIEELFYSMVQRHPYYVLNQKAPLNIYGEPQGEPEYVLTANLFPFQVKLDPTKQTLDKYGLSFPRDAICFFSSKVMRDLGFLPKIGDRFDFTYVDPEGGNYVEHFELMEGKFATFARQAKVPYVLTGAAKKTHKHIRPDR